MRARCVPRVRARLACPTARGAAVCVAPLLRERRGDGMQVEELLQANFGGLHSIFSYYAKRGTAGFTSAKGQVTIQQTELNSLAHDAQLVTKQFSMSRVHEIFQRADRTAEGRAGDRALEVRTTTPSPM